MASTRSLLCGCCASALVAVALAARRGHGSSTPPARGRHGVGAARQAGQNQGVQGYSPPPPAVSPIRGLVDVDFHTHVAPDVFGRTVDDDELAGLAAARQMEAVVFENHVALTADRAWLVRKHVPGIRVFGGITLNG